MRINIFGFLVLALFTSVMFYSPAEASGAKTSSTGEKRQFRSFAFNGTRLVNLPTNRMIGSNDVLFRVSHRFYPEVQSGYDTYFGLNGGADIYIGLGYGISEKLNITVGHTNAYHEWDFSMRWRIAEQWKTVDLPVSMTFHGGVGLITQVFGDESRLESKRVKLNAQLSIVRQLSESISLMLVPSVASNTNRVPFNWEQSAESTFALGAGGRFAFNRQLAFIGEWIPVISGFETGQHGWGTGLEYKTGGHVFQVFITNSLGLTVDQYLPGGDLELLENEFRLGFNIYRSFWF